MTTLTLAIPSKGRLKDDCHAYFADAGAVLKQAAGGRGYRATLGGFPDIEVMLLSASEIAAAFKDKLLRQQIWLPDGRALLGLYQGPATGFTRAQIGVTSIPGGQFQQIGEVGRWYS